LQAGIGDFLDRLLKPGLVAIDGKHLRTFSGEEQRARAADTAPGAGNDGGLPVETSHVSSLCCAAAYMAAHGLESG
jgi:hypothetical protein